MPNISKLKNSRMSSYTDLSLIQLIIPVRITSYKLQIAKIIPNDNPICCFRAIKIKTDV